MNHARFRGALTTATLLAVIGSPAAHAQNIVMDPDFESATLGAHTSDLGDGIYTVAAGQADIVTGVITGQSLQFYNRHNPGVPVTGVQQTLATTGGQTYNISFDFGRDFTIGDVGNLQLQFGGVTVANFDPFASAGPFTFTANNVLATGNTTQLTFVLGSTAFNAGANNNDLIYVDNVSIVANPTPVPEPGSLALLAGGLTFGGFLARRRAR